MQPAHMSADVRLSDQLLNIKSKLLNQVASTLIQNHVTVSCSFCEQLCRRCAELEQKIYELQFAMSSMTSTHQESPENFNIPAVPDDRSMLSIQETLPPVDNRSIHSGISVTSSCDFQMIDNDMDHGTFGSGSVMSSDNEMLLQSIDNAQPLTNCEHDHLCDPVCASVSPYIYICSIFLYSFTSSCDFSQCSAINSAATWLQCFQVL